MLLLLIVITAEGWFASRFYKQAPGETAGSEWRVARPESTAVLDSQNGAAAEMRKPEPTGTV
jgi:hypothetical protein